MSNFAAGTVCATRETIETGRCVLVLSEEPVREVDGYTGMSYVPDADGGLLVLDGYLAPLMVRAADPRLASLTRILTSGMSVDPDAMCEQVFDCDWHTVRTIPASELTALEPVA